LHARSNLFYHADVSSFFFNCVMQQMLQISTRFKIKQMTQISMFFLLLPLFFFLVWKHHCFKLFLSRKCLCVGLQLNCCHLAARGCRNVWWLVETKHSPSVRLVSAIAPAPGCYTSAPDATPLCTDVRSRQVVAYI
jgi:hypothetical protein